MWEHGTDFCKLRDDLLNFLELIDAVIAQDGEPDQRPFSCALGIQNTGEPWNEYEVVAGIFGENTAVQDRVFGDDDLKVDASGEECVWSRLIGNEFGKKTRYESEIRDSRQRADIEDDVRMVGHVAKDCLSALPQCNTGTDILFRGWRRSYANGDRTPK